MKCLSLTQPWASLVAIGAKKIETRSWPCPPEIMRQRERIGIHASKTFPRECRELCWQDPFEEALDAAGIRDTADLPLGKVVAVVRVLYCVPTPESAGGRLTGLPLEPELSFGDYSPGRFAWSLELVRRIEPGVPARGSLGLWEYAGELP